jgi:predicted O-methyltransferase YrrM
MDNELEALLEEVRLHGRAHDADVAERLQRLRNVEADSARVLAVLARAVGARRLLEIGTSNGYSTLWLADAVRSVGGRMTTVDIDASRTAMAARNLQRAGLSHLVDLRVEDAARTLRQSPDCAWDMIFLDAERPFYAGYWPDLVRVLRPGGLLAVDNVISHAEQLEDFRALVTADEHVTASEVPTGAGLLLVVRDPSVGGSPSL